MAHNGDIILKAKDDEIVKLLADNRELTEELRQCQADKEFVWTLWKRLQVSSPDLTQAISLVMQREKEKCEAKDSKVLEILHSKDEQIRNLQETVTSLKLELDKLVQMKSALEETRANLTDENEEIKRNNDILNSRLSKLEDLGQSEAINLKRTLNELKKERNELNDKLTQVFIDLQTSRMESQTMELENDQFKKNIQRLEEDLRDTSVKCQKLQKERESLSEEVVQLKSDLTNRRVEQDSTRRQLTSKEQSRQELYGSYEQLKTRSNEQQDIIIKLQSLNNDSQKVLKQQEKAYKEELAKNHKLYSDLARRYESLQKTHRKLEKSHENLRSDPANDADTMWRREKDHRRQNQGNKSLDDMESQLASQREEIERLRRRLKDKNRLFTEFEDDIENLEKEGNYGLSENTFSPIVERIGRHNKREQVRSRSLSPDGRQMAFVSRRLQATQEKLDSTKRLLELKKEELKQMKMAHDKRLYRLKEYQANYRELSEKMEEKELSSPLKVNKNRKLKRANTRELRHEHSDAVWNELAFYKRENRTLIHDKLSLEEELDNIRVQAAMDKATVQELNMCLKQEKDDLVLKLKQKSYGNRRSSTPKKRAQSQDNSSHHTSATVSSLKHQLKHLTRKLENSTEDNSLLKKEKTQLLKEIKVLKSDNKSLKQDVTDSRQNCSKLRQDIVQLNRKLDDAKDKKIQAEFDAKDFIKEVETARAHSVEERETINALRSENNELRTELKVLKDELKDTVDSLEVAELELAQRNPRTARSSSSPVPVRRPSSKLTSESAQKHEDFLTKSVTNMREMLKKDPAFSSEDTLTYSDEEESDAQSLGERIARAAISATDCKDNGIDRAEPRSGKGKFSARSQGSQYGGSDLSSLKRRIASMQKQCSTLITEKQNALKQVNNEKDRNTLLESEIKGVQSKLKSAKSSIEKLHREVETISLEKEELQRALESVKNSMPEKQRYSDTDYRLLENKMRMTNSDAQHYLEQMRKAQKESDEKQDTIVGLKEKISKLDRDVAMKRQLIEEQRTKIKSMESLAQNDEKATHELENQIKHLSDEIMHKKNYIDSLKRQVQAVGKDKAKYEQSYNETKAELQKRCEQVSVEQAKKIEAERLANQLENTVEKRLDSIASKSEQALEKMQGQLTASEDKNREYSVCVQLLTGQLLDMMNQLRNSIEIQQERTREESRKLRSSDPTMSRAQSIACSILNMSKADFEELMTPVDSQRRDDENCKRSEDTKADREWKNKVEEIAQEQPPFAKSLNRLLWDKIQDAVRLTEEKCRAQYEVPAIST